MKLVKLKIDGQNDRRQLASILADNGYKVFIEVKEDSLIYHKDYFVVIELK